MAQHQKEQSTNDKFKNFYSVWANYDCFTFIQGEKLISNTRNQSEITWNHSKSLEIIRNHSKSLEINRDDRYCIHINFSKFWMYNKRKTRVSTSNTVSVSFTNEGTNQFLDFSQGRTNWFLLLEITGNHIKLLNYV